METMNDGKQVLVDERLRSRVDDVCRQAKIVKGFDPIMPTFQGLLREHEIQGLDGFIKSLGNDPQRRTACADQLSSHELPPPKRE